MTDYFKNLLERFYQATSNDERNTIYYKMLEYVDSYHDGYVCYEMDIYVSLYKCARTSRQRKHALKHIHDIIIDDSFQFIDELIENFKEFTLIAEFLDEKDLEEFDSLCMQVLNFFGERKKESESGGFAGHYETAPEISIWNSNAQLREVAEIVIGANMHNESYALAQTILGF